MKMCDNLSGSFLLSLCTICNFYFIRALSYDSSKASKFKGPTPIIRDIASYLRPKEKRPHKAYRSRWPCTRVWDKGRGMKAHVIPLALRWTN